MPDLFLDTASQRPGPGLDAGARRLILGVLGVPLEDVVNLFFQDRYAGFDDYCRAVAEVWGPEDGARLVSALHNARDRDAMRISMAQRGTEAMAEAMFQLMPEPDFRLAVDLAYQDSGRSNRKAQRITQICRARGAPWQFDDQEGFVWVGDQEVQVTAMAPAVSAIADPRFAGGVKAEFESARQELALGTPAALSQCVHQAASAVESALKVVLDERGVTYDPRDAAQKLFEALRDAGLTEGYMERLILAPATPRNRLGGHGAGAEPHAVPVEVAEAVLASAAVVIAFLRTLLP